jgi:hypothetical protein
MALCYRKRHMYKIVLLDMLNNDLREVAASTAPRPSDAGLPVDVPHPAAQTEQV